MEIKITFEIGEKTIELIKSYFVSKEETSTDGPLRETSLKSAIVAEVKALTKNGKSKYVKDLLSRFDASRVSELDEGDYDEFYKQLREKK